MNASARLDGAKSKRHHDLDGLDAVDSSVVFETFAYFIIFGYFTIVSSLIWIRIDQFLNDILKKLGISLINF